MPELTGRRAVGFVAVLILAFPASRAGADGVLVSTPRMAAPFDTVKVLFPNWLQAPVASFSVSVCDDAVCGDPLCDFTGLTLQNFGTASGGAGGDLTDLYFRLFCGTTDSGVVAMTYAGLWAGVPTWTWAGIIPPSADDLCNSSGKGGCVCSVSVDVFADVSGCPTAGASVQIGPGFNDVLNPGWPGGLYDSCGYSAWTFARYPVVKPIRYIYKIADKDTAVPGDTVSYTIYYGRPGSAPLNDLRVTDSLPPYTHYVPSSASPAPDAGWAPDVGPPKRLRWSTGPVPVTGGPTAELTFKVTVDWGNEEWFEPGSGDIAAPEGEFLFNTAHLAWDPDASCASGRTSNAPTTVVRRYLFWKIGDNDILFAPRIGQPDDEIIYELFVKNMSGSKTWWNVSIWDTVPAEITPWCVNCGFEDPCLGWTMTPSGCSAAAPGWTMTGPTTTMLTWKLDMPPGMTLTVRWKAQVKTTTPADSTAINHAAIQALGRSAVIGGTGDAGRPKIFIHEAPIVLRTTYISYVGWESDTNPFFKGCAQTYYLSFFPLNKATNFALYTKWCCASAPCETVCAGFAAAGGVSPTIDTFKGTCVGGPPTQWLTGCKAERAPARYLPTDWQDNEPSYPFNFLHKLVGNSPVIWELSTCTDGGSDDDANTFVGTSSLTFSGLIGYAYGDITTQGLNHVFYVLNTDPSVPTTVHMFDWNPGPRAWRYMQTVELYNESQWAYEIAVPNFYRFVSSQGRLIIQKATPCVDCGGNKYRDFGAQAPNKENGNLVNEALPATFYAWAGENYSSGEPSVIVGNVGVPGADATYEVWRYQPFDQTLPQQNPSITIDLVGSAGFWSYVDTHTVDAGLAAPLNGHVYGGNYDASTTLTRYRLYKFKVVDGGPIQVLAGRGLFDEYAGGSMVHAAVDGAGTTGNQVGREFWLHTAYSQRNCAYVFDTFCPKETMVVNMTASTGMTATYTTTGPDQCVAFRALSLPAGNTRTNFRVNVLPAGNPGDAIGMFFSCAIAQKYYTAPFVQQGVFYNIIAPPVVYSGQSFWITVVVVDTGGGTKTDYVGTTSFTSTDPNAKIESQLMDGYDYPWVAGDAGVRVFVGVSYTQLGLQALVANDIVDGSIVGLTTIMVVGADVKLTKEPRLAVAASGDTVQFKVCWSNYSSATAFGFTITDAVPGGTDLVPEPPGLMDCGNTDGLVPDIAYATSTSPTIPPASDFTPTGGAPPASTRWLRWTYAESGVRTTGCACFAVRVR